MSQTKMMDLKRVTIDEGIQSRAELDHNLIDEYAQAIGDGAKFPPPVVFFDGSTYWLAGGFHRYFAHKNVGNAATTFEIRTGTKRDAILLSVKENDQHGKRRTAQDKRKAVMLLLHDEIWNKWSDREVAVATNTSHPFVSALRNPEKAAAKKAAKGEVATERTPEPTSRPGITISTPEGKHSESGNVSTNQQFIHSQEDEGSDGDRDAVKILGEALDEAKDTIARLSKGNPAATEEEQAMWQSGIDELRHSYAALQAERDSIASQRDYAINENNELKREVTRLRKRLDQALARA
jgi:FtsZ-binding cell division protein ZapB